VTRLGAWARRQITAHQAVMRTAADGWAESVLIALRDPRVAGRPAHRTVLTLGVTS
jgi:hypothetical protein